MHCDVMCAVGRHRQIVGLGEMCDFHEYGHAAAIGDVRLRIGHTPGSDHLLELPERAQVLARGDRHATLARNPGMPGHVVRDCRLLTPCEVIGLKRTVAAYDLVGIPLHVGADHQWEAVTLPAGPLW